MTISEAVATSTAALEALFAKPTPPYTHDSPLLRSTRWDRAATASAAMFGFLGAKMREVTG